jgi:predicted heme/steroid binding protein
MNHTDMLSEVNSYIQKITHYSQMQVFATSEYQKKFFGIQIDEEVVRMMDFIMNNSDVSDPLLSGLELTKVLTKEDLARNDGSSGKPAYVAVNGTVYDVSMVKQWAGGTHFGLYAGQDLSSEFMGCHNAMLKILEKVPKVGKLRK